MDPNEWKHEMNRMLDSFASQAELSLGKINRCFETMGQPFDDVFRKYYLEMSKQRLDMTFKTVLFSKRPIRRNETESSTNDPRSTKRQSLNLLKNERDADLIEICDSEDGNQSHTGPATDAMDDRTGIRISVSKRLSIEPGRGSDVKPFSQAEPNHRSKDNGGATMIEIYDSDDEEQQFGTQTNADANESHTEMNKNDAAAMKVIPQNNRNDSQTSAADEDHVKPFFKDEPNANNAIEMADIPMIEFDPNEENSEAAALNETGESSNAQQTNRFTNISGNQLKRTSNKRFKCDHCSLAFEYKCYLIQHQPIHANGKLIGVKADSNGQYHCTHCVRKFNNVGTLSTHMKSHKNGQRLYYCVRCLRQFGQKAEKEQHERQCEGHHYECHLCKKYVTRIKSHMEKHMRTHSGAKPFQCMVCNKFFQEKGNLKSHLNTVHSRNK